MTGTFVPATFQVPETFEGPGFHLEPLGPQHNERDHAAWMSSIEHIRATPGFSSGGWPAPMSLERNLSDLEGHGEDFRDRRGFTYSILDGDVVIGCVYIYGTTEPGHDAEVRSWVIQSRADVDVVVWRSLSEWIVTMWPFTNAYYEPRA
jgi:hypothetical protein